MKVELKLAVFDLIQTDKELFFVDDTMSEEDKRLYVLRCINILKAVGERGVSRIEERTLIGYDRFTRFCYTGLMVVVCYLSSSGVENSFKLRRSCKYEDHVYTEIERKLEQLIDYVS